MPAQHAIELPLNPLHGAEHHVHVDPRLRIDPLIPRFPETVVHLRVLRSGRGDAGANGHRDVRPVVDVQVDVRGSIGGAGSLGTG